MIKKKCLVCEKEFLTQQCKINMGKGKFCSKDCYRESKFKPNTTNYSSVHGWLRNIYGRATKCEKCHTKIAKRYDWALLKDKEYECKRENFIQLCRSCHNIYDELGIGKIVSEATKRKLSLLVKGNKYRWKGINKEKRKEIMAKIRKIRLDRLYKTI